MMDNAMEIFTIIGAPARVLGRAPLMTRYLWNGFSRTWHNDDYARLRYGKHYRLRPWLLFDIEELEIVEHLINRGTDKRVLDFRKHQIEALQITAVVGGLVAGAALTTQQLPGMDEVSYLTRALLVVALVMALLATFFTCLQQRTYGFIEEPTAFRAWLSNGVRYVNSQGQTVLQSSTVSQQLLQVPFELLCISITTFLIGIGVYLGSALTQHLDLGSEDEGFGNRAVLITFIVTSIFALSLLGQLLGGKDVENTRLGRLTDAFSVNDRDLPSLDIPMLPRTHNVSPTTNVRDMGDEGFASLASALQEAAAAHHLCAAAEEKTARLWEKIATLPRHPIIVG
ncbi:MAG: hypothetical protein M1816_001815 [Peltula sp. TS41687]|nr:MAG: hypothetical protein M1816_001815 [Peltula sp. TS41687]